MSEFVNAVISSLSTRYFIYQVVAILIIWSVGMVLCIALKAKHKYTLAFPLGLSVFVIEGFIILTARIPYNAAVVLIVYLLTAILPVSVLYRTGELKKRIADIGIKQIVISLAVVTTLGILSCSGLVPLSLSNDSMYYFHEYPRDIVYYGGLRDQFDVFLTDTGLGAIVIDTIPHLFGFNETFGIREFMHISFLLYFAQAVYGYVSVRKSSRYVGVATVLGTFILATSTPVFVLGHWAMANMYFMEFFFIGAYEAVCFAARNEDSLSIEQNSAADFSVIAIPTLAAALMRIEGPIYILYLVVGMSLLPIRGVDLAFKIILPLAALEGGYLLKIYSEYVIDNPYTFMTPQKAVIEIAAILAVAIYMLIIRDKLPTWIKKNLSGIFIACLVGLNLLMLLRNSELYMANMTSFAANLTRQSGWGMLPHLILSSVVILFAVWATEGKIKKEKKPDKVAISEKVYFAVLTVGFVFVAFAVSWARGGALDEQVGDSGNRVLLQIAPIAIYTVILYFTELIDSNKIALTDDTV